MSMTEVLTLVICIGGDGSRPHFYGNRVIRLPSAPFDASMGTIHLAECSRSVEVGFSLGQ